MTGQILEFGDGFSLALQYCEAWGLDSEYEASEHLEALVEAQEPELRRRLALDPTADEIWIRAGARTDLEAAAAIAAAGGAPTGER